MKAYQALLFATFFVEMYLHPNPPNQPVITWTALHKIWIGATVPVLSGCMARTGADPTLIAFYKFYLEYPSNQPLNCTILCAWERLNIADRQSNVNPAVLAPFIPLPPARFQQVLKHCDPGLLPDPCARAAGFDKCLAFTMRDILCKQSGGPEC